PTRPARPRSSVSAYRSGASASTPRRRPHGPICSWNGSTDRSVVNRTSVDPAFTFGVSLVLSALLWYPTPRQAMSGNIEITDAGIRYLMGLSIAWAGVFGVSSLVARYARDARTRPSPPPLDGVRAPVPAQHRSDQQPAHQQDAHVPDSNAA